VVCTWLLHTIDGASGGASIVTFGSSGAGGAAGEESGDEGGEEGREERGR